MDGTESARGYTSLIAHQPWWGMVTDLGALPPLPSNGGFLISILPLHLLAMVDASVGGKTGINFNGLKTR